jgi:ABC-type branched-subunit amino acid transport system substrate-binding protein
MPKGSNTKIARDARLTAEADFATWLMMAKLGSFDDLPKEAQDFLSQYRERLKSATEKDAAAATIDAVYAAYYAKRGGKGTPPPVKPPPSVPEPAPSDNIVRLQDARRARAARTAQSAGKPSGQRRMPVLLIFIGLVAIVIAIRFLMGGVG